MKKCQNATSKVPPNLLLDNSVLHYYSFVEINLVGPNRRQAISRNESITVSIFKTSIAEYCNKGS